MYRLFIKFSKFYDNAYEAWKKEGEKNLYTVSSHVKRDEDSTLLEEDIVYKAKSTHLKSNETQRHKIYHRITSGRRFSCNTLIIKAVEQA